MVPVCCWTYCSLGSCRYNLEVDKLMDFGQIVQNLFQWLVDHWWSIELSFFGLTTTVGMITAWVVVGSVVLWFVRMLLGDEK